MAGTIGAVVGVMVVIGIGFLRQAALAKRSAPLRHRMTGGIVAALLLLQVIAALLVI